MLNGYCKGMVILDFCMKWQMAEEESALFSHWKQKRRAYMNLLNYASI
jgi:hypothetical protein